MHLAGYELPSTVMIILLGFTIFCTGTKIIRTEMIRIGIIAGFVNDLSFLCLQDDIQF